MGYMELSGGAIDEREAHGEHAVDTAQGKASPEELKGQVHISYPRWASRSWDGPGRRGAPGVPAAQDPGHCY
ncbi:hypothetical protein caldi_09240 [Caldinitratiruptor microaerophilus]|uniref:Uncharacterized protein n=1 Tax=Caldinitratiruptor microaerophilus TaxID=671077 RepID=A0AA35CIK4_9FIRM|nr:hypothetical protein caldi_09240 [Caldinitratiruptor microaerophilus]